MTAEHSYQFTSAIPPYGASYGETFIEQGGHTYDNPYKFNGKELDEETGLYYYGARYYDPKMSMWLSVDPLAGHPNQVDKTPFGYAWGNPVRLTDPDGRCPICPYLVKMGANAAADFMMQLSFNYYFGDTQGDLQASLGAVNYWQVSRSGVEGLIPWKTPGGRWGRAAVTALGDVMVNYFDNPDGYTSEQAMQDFVLGMLSDLGGGELGELLRKYDALNVARGFMRLGVPVPNRILHVLEKRYANSAFNAARRNVTFSTPQLQHEFKHSKKFGITENPNKATLAQFRDKLLNLLYDENTIAIPGTYRGTIKGTHYYNTKTHLWMFVKENGEFHTAWKLSPEQREYLLIKRNVQ